MSRRDDRQDLGLGLGTALRLADGALLPAVVIVAALGGDLLPEADLRPDGASPSPSQAVA